MMRIIRLAAPLFLACVIFPGVTPALAALPLAQKAILENRPAPYGGTIQIHISYPETGVAAIDRALAAYIQKHRNDITPDDFTADRPGAVYTSDISDTIKRNDDKMFTVEFNGSTYTGGAHGLPFLDSFTFLLPDGAQIFLPELVDGQRGIDRISKLAIANVTARAQPVHDAQTLHWISTGAGPLAQNFTNFTWGPTQLTIDFPPYQVAAYAFGIVTVHIPLAKLTDVIRPDPRAPSPGFSCARAQNPSEKTICGNTALARLDREVAEHYALSRMNAALVPQPDKSAKLLADQRAFLANRDACGADPVCLTDRYRARLNDLP